VNMNIPNTLSLLRLAMVPLFAVAFFQPGSQSRFWAAGIYAIAFLTDIADGYLARRLNQITRLGRILDPMADKLMTFTVIICIAVAKIIPAWAVVIFFLKEGAMGLGAMSLLHRLDDVIPANWLGKLSTGVFFVVCAALILFPSIPNRWATALISFALVLAVLAFLYYLWLYLSILGKKKTK
jgi:cardiolipin synthase